MDPASARYLIRINGHLGAALVSALPGMTCERRGRQTVLTGVLAEIESLGLELLEVRQITDPESDVT
jgi:hypothetical protein